MCSALSALIGSEVANSGGTEAVRKALKLITSAVEQAGRCRMELLSVREKL